MGMGSARTREEATSIRLGLELLACDLLVVLPEQVGVGEAMTIPTVTLAKEFTVLDVVGGCIDHFVVGQARVIGFTLDVALALDIDWRRNRDGSHS